MRLYEYIQQGGAIMYILLLLNIVGMSIMLAKFFLFNKQKTTLDVVAADLANKIEGPAQGKDTGAKIEMIKQELAQYIGKVEKGLNTIKIIASISPLLGLLGTVLGVLVAFQVMSQKGLSDPSYFAQGISMALITTVGGLLVAIPHFIGHSYLMGMLDDIESGLEKNIIGKIL
jgi:biopolymer transport protein ExbB